MEDIKVKELPKGKPRIEMLWDRIYLSDNLEHEEICEEAFEIFKQQPIQIAPAKKLLCSRILCTVEWLDGYIDRNGDLAAILEQVTLQQELEVFKRWADGQLRESSAQALLREIRGEDPTVDLSAVFNGDGEDG
jgi:hypothetical protein